MNRSIRLATSTLTACTALVLSACGGSGADEDNGKIAGADTGTKKSASPSPSATADGIDRPEIKLPADMKNAFEGRETGDAVKDAILADNERRINAVDAALASGDLKHSAIAYYTTDRALTGLTEYTKRAVDKNISWTGTTRYFDRQVTIFSQTSAAVTYCADESRSNAKDRKTNKVTKVKTSPDSYVYYNTAMTKNKDGVWQTRDLSEDRGAQRCQR
ncbi:hypothetical protein [Streptomyces sp. Je 1-369]|uniref:hypothetical protein n=1 Tax=Streptomyces sp. Je 1-369 TaxID=2966192 RepID=UPI0022869F92|nr:hypothetical protein [Streptomyces sp. Je 1-369]WAL96448.1 hypothetical protein NOO62_19385 [Streptomyces sp. Je 1-369]